MIPTRAITTPKRNNHPVIGSNRTNKTPIPIPTKHTPMVFLKSLNIIYYLLKLYYIILFYVKKVICFLGKLLILMSNVMYYCITSNNLFKLKFIFRKDY